MTARFGRPTFTPDKLIKYSSKWQYARLMNFPYRGSHWRPRMKSIIVSVDGGSRGNDSIKRSSRAAFGVSFGPGCIWNVSHVLKPNEPQTSSRAELEAVRQALQVVLTRRAQGEFDGWREVIIKTDSDYVAKSLTQYIWEWQVNGYRKADGKPVKHAELIQEIHATISAMEQHMSIRFWRVDRQWNMEADALVNRALDGASDSGYEDN
jgi:ribonuclease HI